MIMEKLRCKKIEVAEKIKIYKSDLLDGLTMDDVHSKYTWLLPNEQYSIIEEYNNCDYFYLPKNSWWDIEAETIVDNRNMPKFETPKFLGTLRETQQIAVDNFLKTKNNITRSGILMARPRWGKTVAACNIISNTNTTCLILVKDIMSLNQWIREIKTFLDYDAGCMGNGKVDIKPITVGIYKTVLNNMEYIYNSFGMVMIDECHNAGANMYNTCINNLNARISIGISGTPKRKDGRDIMMKYHFTPFIFDAKEAAMTTYFSIIPTDYKVNIVDVKKDWSRSITVLGQQTSYLNLIAKYANRDISNDRCLLIIFERVDTLNALKELIPGSEILIGSTKSQDREDIKNRVGKDIKCILTTTLFDEAITCARLDTLYICTPGNNPYKLEQRIGRIQNEYEGRLHKPLIRDFNFKGNLVTRQQKKRMSFYINRKYKEKHDLL